MPELNEKDMHCKKFTVCMMDCTNYICCCGHPIRCLPFWVTASSPIIFIIGIAFVVVESARNMIPSPGGMIFGIFLIVLSVLFFLWWLFSLRFLKEPIYSMFYKRYTHANFGMLPLDRVIVDHPNTAFPLLFQGNLMN